MSSAYQQINRMESMLSLTVVPYMLLAYLFVLCNTLAYNVLFLYNEPMKITAYQVQDICLFNNDLSLLLRGV